MPKPIHDLHLDFETYCDLDLKKVGLYRYVEHPSFRVICVAWKLDEQQTKWALVPSHDLAWFPSDLIQILRSPDVQGHAWNAAFETAVLKRLCVFVANPQSCTMQRALAYGLPGKLEAAAAALGVAAQKDMVGHRLMLKMSRPSKDGTAPVWSAADYHDLAIYCAKDVNAEAAVSAVIPQLQPEEAELSALDAAMNTGGELGIDISRVNVLRTVAEAAEKTDAARCAVLTGGAVTSPGTQTARLMTWLATQGINLADTTRASIEEELLTCAAPVAREVLEIRLRMARASTRKLARMYDMCDPNTLALEGQFQFCPQWCGPHRPLVGAGASKSRIYRGCRKGFTRMGFPRDGRAGPAPATRWTRLDAVAKCARYSIAAVVVAA